MFRRDPNGRSIFSSAAGLSKIVVLPPHAVVKLSCQVRHSLQAKVTVPSAAFPASKGYSHIEREFDPMKTFVVVAAIVLGALSTVAIPHQAAVACSRACINCCTP